MKKIQFPLTGILLLFLGILVIPLNCVSLAVAWIMLSDAQASIRSSIQTTIKTYTVGIDQVIRNTENFLFDFSQYDPEYNAFFTQQDSLDYQLARQAIASTITEKLQYMDLADYYFFYHQDPDDFMVIPHNTNIFDEYLSMDQQTRWHLVHLEGKPYLLRTYLMNDTYYGAIIDLNRLVEGIEANIRYPVEEISFFSEVSSSSGSLWITADCEKADLVLALRFQPNILRTSIPIIRWALIGVILLYIILFPVLYWFVRKWTILPLRVLNEAHNQLQKGNQGYRIQTISNSPEFQQAYCSFNDMADSIQNLRLENIDKELARNKMLLDNLQLQIRPHFLLNTFNLLYSMIQTQNTSAASSMILYLSQYFRYLFQYSCNLEIFPKEFDLIQHYIEISHIQYPGAFTFQYEFDPEISCVRVPPLLIHNFIENILSHALVHGKVTHIMFVGTYENGIVTFQIADDGRGMDPEDVQRINEGTYEDYSRGSHVGLRNSITRLKYFYHGKANLHVESTLNEGTIFTITFPYNLEEEGD